MVDLLMPKPLKPCPSVAAYTRGCRCDGCKAAKAEQTALYAESNRERARQWRVENPEKSRAATQRWKDANRSKVRALGRAYVAKRQAEDPEGVRAYRRAWAKTDKGRLANRLARHARRGAPTDREYAEIILLDPCAYCGERGGEIDHITPVSDGGSGDRDNLTPACRRHNAAKNDQRLLTFLAKEAC